MLANQLQHNYQHFVTCRLPFKQFSDIHLQYTWELLPNFFVATARDLRWETKVVDRDTFGKWCSWYLTSYSILFASKYEFSDTPGPLIQCSVGIVVCEVKEVEALILLPIVASVHNSKVSIIVKCLQDPRWLYYFTYMYILFWITVGWMSQQNLFFFFLQQHQHSEKNQEILTLRQHIQILQQEHLSKISRIAELEAQLQSLKVTKTE